MCFSPREKLLREIYASGGGLLAASVNAPVLLLSRVSTMTRDIDIAILSVCLSVCPPVRDVPVLDENGLTYCDNFAPNGSQIILVLPISNIFRNSDGVTPVGALNTGGV